jgi:signal transduction histidine kinase
LVSEYLSSALSTVGRARGLTDQLLTFAKGGAPIQKISRLFPFVEENALFALSGSNVSCHFEVADDLWACYYDKNQIGQVIDNIFNGVST